jgi:hypothetical protein
MKLKNKKAEETLTEQVIFIILNLLFFCILLAFIIRTGSSLAIQEETYSKKIALIIDSMKSGTEIHISYEAILKNSEIKDAPIKIDKDNRKVTVKLRDKGGYTFSYFNNGKIDWSLDNNNKILIIKT